MDKYKWDTPLSLNHIIYKRDHYYYNDPILLKQPRAEILKDRYLKQMGTNVLQDVYTGATFRFEGAPIKSDIRCRWNQIDGGDDFYLYTMPMYDLETNLEVERIFRKEHYYSFKVYLKDKLNNYLVSLSAVSLTVTIMNLSSGLWRAIFAGGFFDIVSMGFIMAAVCIIFWLLIKLLIFNEDL